MSTQTVAACLSCGTMTGARCTEQCVSECFSPVCDREACRAVHASHPTHATHARRSVPVPTTTADLDALRTIGRLYHRAADHVLEGSPEAAHAVLVEAERIRLAWEAGA